MMHFTSVVIRTEVVHAPTYAVPIYVSMACDNSMERWCYDMGLSFRHLISIRFPRF